MILNFSYDSSVDNAPAGFTDTLNAVALFFQNIFSDPVTVNIAVGYGEINGQALDSGALGESVTSLSRYSYAQIKSALEADAKSADDTSAVASLPVSDPTGGHYRVSTAEAKALGLAAGKGLDGHVGFSSSHAFDYNESDGVAVGQFDFFGVVAHEVSEVMGRQLLVGATIGNTSNNYEVMDLFHFSAQNARIFSGTQLGYFSLDNGVTNLGDFNANPGGDFGDWAASAGHDAALAFSRASVVNAFSQNDIRVMDAIGWDATSGAGNPPPPSPIPADLTASNFALSSTSVSFIINNMGLGAASASAAGVYLSADANITAADSLLATVATPSLASGVSHQESASITLPDNLTPGTYYLSALADSGNQITESNKANNASNAVPVILGDSSSDALTGTSGNDLMFGLGGNDTLDGGAGNDILDGGPGFNTVTYQSATQGVWIDLNAGASSSGHDVDTLLGIEKVIGSTFNDTFVGSNGDDVFDGGGGSDQFYGRGGNDTVTYQSATQGVWIDLNAGASSSGHDVDTLLGIEKVIGSTFNDTFVGSNGDDVFDGGGGSDQFYGRGGFDTVTYESATQGVWIDLNAGASSSGHDVDTLLGIEKVIGSTFNDTFVGSNGDDVFDGGGGSDQFYGRGGFDTVTYESATQGVWIDLNAGASSSGHDVDTLLGIEKVIGSTFNDTFVGSNGDDVFDGGGGSDQFYGRGGNDTLIGSNGDDSLNGGSGIDVLTGNIGNDTFIFQRGEANGDIITDFSGNGAAAGDQLQFTGYGTAAQGATFSQIDANHWSINSSDGLEHDVITFQNGAMVHPSDIVFL